MGRFLRTVIPMSARSALILWPGYGEPDASLWHSHGGYGFSGAYCASCLGGEFTFRSGALHVCDGREVKGLIHDIKYHGARMILRDMPSWVDRCDGFREYLRVLFWCRLSASATVWVKGALIKVSGLLTLS